MYVGRIEDTNEDLRGVGRENGLNWNPSNSQMLRIKGANKDQDTTPYLYGVHISFAEDFASLGLLLLKVSLKRNDPGELKTKCMGPMQIVLPETWFNLGLNPTHIYRAYKTSVRNILLYGSELLSHTDRQPMYGLANKLMGTVIEKLLNLGRGLMSAKHRMRIPTRTTYTVVKNGTRCTSRNSYRQLVRKKH